MPSSYNNALNRSIINFKNINLVSVLDYFIIYSIQFFKTYYIITYYYFNNILEFVHIFDIILNNVVYNDDFYFDKFNNSVNIGKYVLENNDYYNAAVYEYYNKTFK